MADRNEMNVPLIDNFRLRADDLNWIIEEVSSEGKNYKVFGYYQHLDNTLQDVYRTSLRRSPSKSIEDLMAQGELVSKRLAEAVTRVNNLGFKVVELK